MSTWYSKQLGDGNAAFGPSHIIQEAFFNLSVISAKEGESLSDVAIFSECDLSKNMVTVYFTPNAKILARAFNANPCSKPTPTEMFGLLVGDANSWESYFPGYLKLLRNSRF